MVFYDTVSEYGTVSVATIIDGKEHREALVPGQFDRAREILPTHLYQEIFDLWTLEIVQKYKDLINAYPSITELYEPVPSDLEIRVAKLEDHILTIESQITDLIEEFRR